MHIKYTIAEMDVMAMFFVLLSMLFFVRATKYSKTLHFAFSGVFMGLAIYTKVYPLLFIPSLLIYFFYFNRKNDKQVFSNSNIKKLILFLFVIFIFSVPALTHNYLLYQDKGFLDLQFTRTLGLGKNISAEYYSWDAQFNAKNSWGGLIFGDKKHSASGDPLLYVALKFIFRGDPINFIFGFFGLIFILGWKKNYRNYAILFLLSLLFALPFLASIILLPKHFIFIEILLIPLSAFFIIELKNNLSHINKNFLTFFLALILIFSLFYLGLYSTPTNSHFYGKSSISQIIEFKDFQIPKNALIVSDGRIYRGRTHWVSYGRPYLEAINFVSMINSQDQIPGEFIPVDVYFIECVTDDCGWGTIKDQPELNQTMESLTSFF